MIKNKNLIFCFVFIDKDKKYRTFFVPSEDVAKYCKWQQKFWLDAEHKKPVKEGDMRKFRVKLDEKSPYEDNFKLFE